MTTYLKSSASSNFLPLPWRNTAIVCLLCILLHVFVMSFKHQNNVTRSNAMTDIILQWQLTSASMLSSCFKNCDFLLWIFYVFVLSCVCCVLCASVYMCFVVTCWERADLLALVCGVFCEFVTFPLVSWVRCGTWLYQFLIFATLLLCHIHITRFISVDFIGEVC